MLKLNGLSESAMDVAVFVSDTTQRDVLQILKGLQNSHIFYGYFTVVKANHMAKEARGLWMTSIFTHPEFATEHVRPIIR